MRVLALPLALLGAALLVPLPVRADERDHAGALFEKRCAHCHTVPDPAIRTDRAWLDQVNRTS